MPPPLERYAATRSNFLLAYLGDDPDAPRAVVDAAARLSAALGVAVSPMAPDQWAEPPALRASAIREARRSHAVIRVIDPLGWRRSLDNLLREVGRPG